MVLLLNKESHLESYDMYDITTRQILNNISEKDYCYFIVGGVNDV